MKDQNLFNLLSDLFLNQDSVIFPSLLKTRYPWELHEILTPFFNANREIHDTDFPFVHWKNKKSVFIGQGVIIEPGALIEGPCYIGDGVMIGHSALIRAGTFLAPGSYVGHCSEVARSIFFEGAKAPHFNYIGDSIVGTNVNLGAHVVLTNLRLDCKEVRLLWDKQLISTGKRKFGSIIGDNSSIGAGSILNPGTIIRPNSKIPPLTVQKGFI